MDALILFSSCLIGSAPLGGFFVAWAARRKPNEVLASNLGLENVLRSLGLPVALTALLLDVLKGALALALFAGSPWAALGVYAGHLYPLTWLPYGEVPRGRGNGVLLGVLLGLGLFGSVPLWLTGMPLLVFAALLAWRRYVTLATLAGLLTFALLSLTQSAPLALALSLTFLLGLWRHKVGLARILDQTEPKLGDPPPVHGADPNVVVAAFMIHPLTLADVWQPASLRWLGWLTRRGVVPESLLRRALRLLRPQKQSEIRGIRLADGRELRVVLISGPLFPKQIRDYPEDAGRVAVQGARLAHELGAEAFGLGGFWSTVGDKGKLVQEAVPEIHVTNGGAYTAATVKAAVPGLLARFKAEGRLKRPHAAIVGANGVVAFGVARMVASEVARLVLIGRDATRLARSAETLQRKYPETQIEISTDAAACADADLVFTATSDPNPVLYAEHLKPDTWVFDLGRPADADESVRAVPGVRLIPGGVVRPPGEMRSPLDLHFGDGLVPACLAETMIMSATRAFDRKSLGSATRTADIAFYLREGARLGFEVVTQDVRTKVTSPRAARGRALRRSA